MSSSSALWSSLLAAAICAPVFGMAACGGDPDATPIVKKDTGVSDAKTDGVVIDEGIIDTGTAPDVAKDTATDTKTDGGAGCDKNPGDKCDLVKQDCPGTQTCAYSAGATACTSRSTGAGTKADPCVSDSDCDRGLECQNKKCTPACCPGDNSVCIGSSTASKGGQCNISLTDGTTGKVVYHICSYDDKCNPFKYDCAAGQICLFSEGPDLFKCSTPSTAGKIDTKPGGSCKYRNDCGESQLCTELTTGGDAGTGVSTCYLFCWLSKPSGWTAGTTPGGRFPADGTCTVGGTSYGICTKIGGIDGGLGLCVQA